MNRRWGLGALALVFVVLVGVTISQGVLATRRLPTALATPTFTAGLVFGTFTVLDIQAIRLSTTADGEFVLARASDGTWTAPGVPGTLDAATATLVARTIVLLPYTRTFTAPADDDQALRAYGLHEIDPERLLVQVLLADGTGHALVVGTLTPTQEGFYAVVDDRAPIYVLDARAIAFLRQQVSTPPVA